ncbi:MAG: ATP-dependent helicase HrpB [Steroidobacteraceae bacterium]|jgi:ATP-dependent helicase HrpB|nr:ATP-dependent helicase HrpB [Steroidobacteraceae bacterium]
MRDVDLPALPIIEALPALRAALRERTAAVLEAPPGAGKSTVVPLALLDEPWLAGRRIVVLEPRRLAARAVAERMAGTLGERAGGTVGYRMRLETRVSRTTRIEVVTEGILARLLLDDPALEGVGLVAFDEFHERSLPADLGLALCLDAQRNLRDDLRLLAMSATLDGGPVARLLADARGDAPVVRATGRAFEVETRYAKRPPEHVEREVANTVRRALAEEPGDALVFLPGAPEIRRVERNLLESELPRGTRVLPLYGELPPDAQDAALAPSPPGTRKVVLATSIAETSLTIDGVRIVVDAGLARRSRFDPVTGMSRLETLRASLASADQRRGRAGRTQPGVCYRVWTEEMHRKLPAAQPPEIAEADLAPLALDLACWGTPAESLAWLDPPPGPALAQARDLLAGLGALDAHGRITAAGRRMAALGLHPRLAHLLLRARDLGAPRLGAELAALLSERDFARATGGPGSRDSDIVKRLELLRGGHVVGLEADRGARERARRLADTWERQLGGSRGETAVDPGLLLAFAYPDRIGRRRGETGRYLLSGGRGAAFAGPDALAAAELLIVPELDAGEREARIHLAAPVALEDLERHCAEAIATTERVEWDRREQAVVARREQRLGAIVLRERAATDVDGSRLVSAMLDGVRALGLDVLPWTKPARALQTRLEFLRRVDAPPGRGSEWPDVADAALAGTLEHWLAPWLDGITRREHLARLDLVEILRARLDYPAQQALDRLAPTHLEVPSGSRIPIDYGGDAPSIAVRLQEMFGLTTTPTVADGRVPLTVELLSPAGRPVQVTRDLASFWARGYAEVKKELKGRYPKHYWPDDPLQARPTARVRPR